jgi:hypothetical protein
MSDNEMNDDPGTPTQARGESLNTLGAVRRRLAKAIKDFEAKKGIEKIEIDRLRALIYGYGTLGSIVKDESLDEIMARVDALESKQKEQTK